MRKKPIQIILFSLIFGGIIKLITSIPFLASNKIIALFMVFIAFIAAVLITYYIFENYLKQYFKRK